ncbi:MAG TPA: hypothetical protein VF173_01815 [Thermoanaerobaculia bacterium]|nr:hypothetical protein [Thermoanaerobaculia bacterium]
MTQFPCAVMQPELCITQIPSVVMQTGICMTQLPSAMTQLDICMAQLDRAVMRTGIFVAQLPSGVMRAEPYVTQLPAAAMPARMAVTPFRRGESHAGLAGTPLRLRVLHYGSPVAGAGRRVIRKPERAARSELAVTGSSPVVLHRQARNTKEPGAVMPDRSRRRWPGVRAVPGQRSVTKPWWWPCYCIEAVYLLYYLNNDMKGRLR